MTEWVNKNPQYRPYAQRELKYRLNKDVEPKKIPPGRFNSWEKWFEAMAEGVIDREVTVEQIIAIIRNHFSHG